MSEGRFGGNSFVFEMSDSPHSKEQRTALVHRAHHLFIVSSEEND